MHTGMTLMIVAGVTDDEGSQGRGAGDRSGLGWERGGQSAERGREDDDGGENGDKADTAGKMAAVGVSVNQVAVGIDARDEARLPPASA